MVFVVFYVLCPPLCYQGQEFNGSSLKASEPAVPVQVVDNKEGKEEEEGHGILVVVSWSVELPYIDHYIV